MVVMLNMKEQPNTTEHKIDRQVPFHKPLRFHIKSGEVNTIIY